MSTSSCWKFGPDVNQEEAEKGKENDMQNMTWTRLDDALV